MRRLLVLLGVVVVVVVVVEAQDQNHYRVLGVPREATTADIKAAFRRQAREKHPDKTFQKKCKGRKSRCAARLNDEFAKLSTAYEVLRNEDRRRTYDLKRPRYVSSFLFDFLRDANAQLVRATEALRWWFFQARRRPWGFGIPASQRTALAATDAVVLALGPRDDDDDDDVAFYRRLCAEETCYVVDCTGFFFVTRCWRMPLGSTAFYVDPRRKKHRLEDLLSSLPGAPPNKKRDSKLTVDAARRIIARRRYEALPLKDLRARLNLHHKRDCKPPTCIDKTDFTNVLLDLEFPSQHSASSLPPRHRPRPSSSSI
eukprot:CAMPEP_0118915644 /NCGR_PEP_ID=MMETSP1166-20130328/15768_1 /TAXON_ID=1104430 /ORGANISM="Chrysoreinhardia sp, Strain CCMP3193" /LENGTH=313 /DNA_ID=CAMNT_0006855363 /DNA_START=198 /DNA_END=1142 /DNA_ORIENTATION=-